ncbi:unnamed protein product [Moneuplotes crassus]|uniref:Uncharacterized protein n=1 Tax=Euplotes crassus TaxID=5936 RepID=A0AAD2DCW6_EUPCR|nr:unnamed protein product [Moneuplotes crassus]
MNLKNLKFFRQREVEEDSSSVYSSIALSPSPRTKKDGFLEYFHKLLNKDQEKVPKYQACALSMISSTLEMTNKELFSLSKQFFYKKDKTQDKKEKHKKFLEFHLKLEIALQEQKERYRRLHKDKLIDKIKRIAHFKVEKKCEIPLSTKIMFNLGQVEKNHSPIKKARERHNRSVNATNKAKYPHLRLDDSVLILPQKSMERFTYIKNQASQERKKRSKNSASVLMKRPSYAQREISQNDLDRVFNSLKDQSAQNELSSVEMSVSKNKALNWNSMQELLQFEHDQRVLESLIHQGKVQIEGNVYQKGIKVDKAIREITDENKNFFKFYKDKFSIDAQKINPFVNLEYGSPTLALDNPRKKRTKRVKRSPSSISQFLPQMRKYQNRSVVLKPQLENLGLEKSKTKDDRLSLKRSLKNKISIIDKIATGKIKTAKN